MIPSDDVDGGDNNNDNNNDNFGNVKLSRRIKKFANHFQNENKW